MDSFRYLSIRKTDASEVIQNIVEKTPQLLIFSPQFYPKMGGIRFFWKISINNLFNIY
jgi:hypothetical protein